VRSQSLQEMKRPGGLSDDKRLLIS
jgi:hypothetical protein